jgi:hypothetical protein
LQAIDSPLWRGMPESFRGRFARWCMHTHYPD